MLILYKISMGQPARSKKLNNRHMKVDYFENVLYSVGYLVTLKDFEYCFSYRNTRTVTTYVEKKKKHLAGRPNSVIDINFSDSLA